LNIQNNRLLNLKLEITPSRSAKAGTRLASPISSLISEAHRCGVTSLSILTTVLLAERYLQCGFLCPCGTPRRGQAETEVSPLFTDPLTFLPRMLLITGGYVTLTVSTEKLRKLRKARRVGFSLPGERLEGVGHGWDTQAFKEG